MRLTVIILNSGPVEQFKTFRYSLIIIFRFIVDRRIFVVGFGLYGSIHGPSEYDVTIQLLHTGSGRYCTLYRQYRRFLIYCSIASPYKLSEL